MVLEATILCIDNSEYVRNSDFLPTRLQAEADAMNLLAGAKTQSNPENSVGVLSLGGKVPKVLVTPTQDLGAVLNSVHAVQMEGTVNIATGVQVAHLALKHRQNKHQRMRIVLFVGSPIPSDQDNLVAVGKKLRKCNVAVDVVSFGDVEENAEKLEAFIGSVNKNNNSNLVTVPHGAVLADVLLSTPIFLDADSAGAGGSGFAAAAAAAQSAAAQGNIEGADMDMMGTDDPALLLALRVSLEEERARQEAQAQAETTTDAPAVESVQEDTSMDEEALLQQAIALSMPGADGAAPSAMDTNAAPTAPKVEDETDPALLLAMQMSMGDESMQTDNAEKPTNTGADMGELMSDSSYVNSILAGLPGVDTSDPAIQQTLNNLEGEGDKDKETEEDK